MRSPSLYTFLGVAVACAGVAIFLGNSTQDIESYSDLGTPQLVSKYGYPVETHEVVTQDGYILGIHRIPFSPKSPATSNKSVVLLLHGIVACSADYVVLGPGKSQAFHHADNGYDVWMVNFRGNMYSRKHKQLSPSSEEFWDFSFHEMGIYDITATIDYVLNATRQENLYVAAVSMGTTAYFAMMSSRPEYNSKVRIMTAMAPIVVMPGNWKSVMSCPTTAVIVDVMYYYFGVRITFRSTAGFKMMADTLCKNKVTRYICLGIMYAFAGYDPDNLEMENLPKVFAHLSDGVCFKTVEHMSQTFWSGKFLLFDYGGENMKRYNQSTPPEYNLKAVSSPVAILYGSNDPLSTPDLTWALGQSVGNLVKYHRVSVDTFSHFGFMYGNNAKSLVFDVVSDLFLSY